jgi:hypothetical protein
MIMKKLLGIFAFVAISAFIFTSCETEDPIITIVGDAVIAFDLGADFVDPGVTVENGKADDVVFTFSPEYNKNKVDQYMQTYTLGTATATRTVWVKSDLLQGGYTVVDSELANPYNNEVIQSSTDYNKLRIKNFGGYGATFEVIAVINGDDIIVVKHTPSGWDSRESVEATGTYNGVDKKLVSFDYIFKELDNQEEIVTFSGVMTFTRVK